MSRLLTRMLVLVAVAAVSASSVSYSAQQWNAPQESTVLSQTAESEPIGVGTTGCSYVNDPDRGCENPQDTTDCADCCRGAATCCECCTRMGGRHRRMCKAACRDTFGGDCDSNAP